MSEHVEDLKTSSKSRVVDEEEVSMAKVDEKLKFCNYSSKRGLVFVLACLLTACSIASVVLTVLLVRKSSACQQQNSDIQVSASSSTPSFQQTDRSEKQRNVMADDPWPFLRLPRTVIPSRYDLQLTVDIDKFEFSGSVDIRVKVLESTDLIVLQATELIIEDEDVLVLMSSNEKRVEIDRILSNRTNETFVIKTKSKLLLGIDLNIRFQKFDGKLGDDLRGLYRSSYKALDGTIRYLAVSQLQSIDARRVFPCFDEPDMKAVFSVTIRHSKDYVALSNTLMKSSIDVGGGWVEDTFEDTPVMSTYLLAFLVADFVERAAVTDDGLTIRIWSRADMSNQTSYALRFAQSAFKFFADFFDCPEHVNKSDHAAIPDFSAGAMENWGLIFYRETALLYDDAFPSLPSMYWVSLVMAHEIAHSWFGNMVTMKWWEDLWLNEGFANTLMYFALDFLQTSWSVFDLQLINNIHPVMTKDALVTSHAVSTPITQLDDINVFFDAISYDKGMAVLRMLRGFLGWTNFKEGLRRYIREFKFSNADMSQLWDVFEKTSNFSYKVGAIMNTWTVQMGFPVVTVRNIGNGRYRLEQKRFLINPQDTYNPELSPYGYKWIIPFSFRTEKNRHAQTVWMNMTSAEIQTGDSSWILGNVEAMGFFRTNYEEEMWYKLIEQLHTNKEMFSTANRASLINDAFNLARAGMLSYEVAFNLSMYLHNEKSYVPWKAFFDSMEFIVEMLSSCSIYGNLKKFLHNLIYPKFKEMGTSEKGELLTIKLRQLMFAQATNVGVKEAVSWARDKFQAWKSKGKGIPPHFAVTIYSVGVREGDEEEWEFLWEKLKNVMVASEAEMLMNALVHTRQQWLLWRYATYSLNSSLIKVQDVRNLFKFFSATPLSRAVALQFLFTNWDVINSKFETDSFLLRDIISATMNAVNTEYQYQQLEKLFKDKTPPGVAIKSFENSLSLIRSNIKWMETNELSIGRWLEDYVNK